MSVMWPSPVGIGLKMMSNFWPKPLFWVRSNTDTETTFQRKNLETKFAAKHESLVLCPISSFEKKPYPLKKQKKHDKIWKSKSKVSAPIPIPKVDLSFSGTLNSALCLFTNHNNFLWVCWILVKNLYVISLSWKLDNEITISMQVNVLLLRSRLYRFPSRCWN